MGDIGLTYFVIIIIAWYYKFRRQDEIKELALLIVNRMLFIPFLGFGMLLLLRFAHYNSPGVVVFGNSHLFINVQIIVNSFFLLISMFLLIPSRSRNIKISTIFGILLFFQFLAVFFPELSLERLIYLLIYDDDISLSHLTNGVESAMKNFAFFAMWLILFYFIKMGIEPKPKLE